tara:strand:- start:923 stop:1558 length:636 start_codon:yes stop_codon:yes gene_type:complete
MTDKNRPGPDADGTGKNLARTGPDRKLTRRQEKFVKELISNDGLITKREAAIRAGFPQGSAHARAYELTNPRLNPHVVSEIERYREELDEQYKVGYKRHVRDLQKIRDIALDNGAYSAAVQAEIARGRAQGDIYVSKSEIRTGSIDSMSREDVERELERIRASFEPVIDVTPAEVEEHDSEVGADEPRGRPVADTSRRSGKKRQEDRDDEA